VAKEEKISRRDFLLTSAGAVVSIAAWSPGLKSTYDPKGLPTRSLGKTGVQVPFIALGTGSRFCALKDELQGLTILNHALDNGLYYWDTASLYSNSDGSVISEERLGKVLKKRRNEVFLSTKVSSRNPDEAKAELERSLKRLQTDHIDLYQIHSVNDMDDVETLFKTDGLVKFVDDVKRQGIVRFVGFTGHASAKALKSMVERYDFDTMLCALNHYRDSGNEPREEEAITAAAKKGMGILVMKVIRPRETVKNISSEKLVNYALSLPAISCAVIGQDSVDVLKANIEIIRNFKPLPKEEMDRIRTALVPFYNNKKLEWLQPHYTDGQYS